MRFRLVASLYDVTKSSVLGAVESVWDIYSELLRMLNGDFSSSSSSSKTSSSLARASEAMGRSCGCHDTLRCRGVHDGVVWTNFLVVPSALTYFSKAWYLAALLVLLSGTASFIFHLKRENQQFFLLDAVLASLAFFATVPACIVNMDVRQFAVMVLILVVAFWFKGSEDKRGARSYEFYHAMWHATIAVGQLFLATACV